MLSHQTEKLHSKGDKREDAACRMRENICKLSTQKGLTPRRYEDLKQLTAKA
jgi:hypothetical protein